MTSGAGYTTSSCMGIPSGCNLRISAERTGRGTSPFHRNRVPQGPSSRTSVRHAAIPALRQRARPEERSRSCLRGALLPDRPTLVDRRDVAVAVRDLPNVVLSPIHVRDPDRPGL